MANHRQYASLASECHLHGLLVLGDKEMLGSQIHGSLALVLAGANHSHLTPHGCPKLDRHVACIAECSTQLIKKAVKLLN